MSSKHSFFTRCPPSHFSETTWHRNNACLNKFGKNSVLVSQNLRSDAWNTLNVAEANTKYKMNKNTSELESRSKHVMFWRNEVLKEMNFMNTEIDTLLEQKRILEKALYDTNHTLKITEENVLQRLKRKGIEQVDDEPERALCKEVEIIKRCQRRMSDMVDRANTQARLNRCSLHALDIDARDKLHAQLLDSKLADLKTCSFGLGFHPKTETVDTTISTTMSHIHYTRELINRSISERENSRRLRDDMDLLLRQCAHLMVTHFYYVNQSISKRLEELNCALKKDERNLVKTNVEIRDLERALSIIRNAIAEKEYNLKLAKTRLESRNYRICVENSADAPNTELREEIYNLRQINATLREKQKAMEDMLRKLFEVRNNLELDISTKKDAIKIDDRCVLSMRKEIPRDPKVGPFFLLENTATAGSTKHGTDCSPICSKAQAGCCIPVVPTFTGVACCM